MNRHYISDVYEHDQEAMRKRALSIDMVLIAVSLAIIFAIALFSPRRAHADEPFVLSKPSCYPLAQIVGLGSAVDFRVKMSDPWDLAIWWCETPTGLERNYRGGEYGRLYEVGFRQAIDSIAKVWELDKARFNRPLNEPEKLLLLDAERMYEPRCVFGAAGKTTGILDLAHGARNDDAGVAIRVSTAQRPSCWQWQLEGAKRYCSVEGLTDTKGRAVPELSYVACKVVTAPEAGWAQ